jgi:hypothetical protein
MYKGIFGDVCDSHRGVSLERCDTVPLDEQFSKFEMVAVTNLQRQAVKEKCLLTLKIKNLQPFQTSVTAGPKT